MKPKPKPGQKPGQEPDPFREPNFRRFAQDVLKRTRPAIERSSYVITVAPDGGLADVKIAVEIGLAILLDKPLIVLAPSGRHAAPKLLRIADHVITGDPSTPAGQEAIAQALERIMTQ